MKIYLEENLFKKSLLIFISFIIFILTISLVSAIDFSSCGETLNTAGVTYYLTADIIDNATSPCIEVNNNNIIVDCQGYQIDGDGSADYGIYISNQNNVTIQNCVFGDWDKSAIDNDGDSNTFKDSNFTNPVGYGVYTDADDYLLFQNLRFETGQGINLNYFDGEVGEFFNVTVEDCYFLNMGSPIIALRPQYNIYRDNIFSGIQGYPSIRDDAYRNQIYNNIWLNHSESSVLFSFGSGSGDNINESLVYNNIFNRTNTSKPYFAMWGWVDALATNTFNTTQQYGTRIFGEGIEIGGNWFTNADGTGYSDSCIDNDQNGFCDISYTPQAWVEDFLALSSNWTSYQTCVDFDDGITLGIASFVRITVIGTGEIIDHYDECATETRIYEQYCNGTVRHEINTPCPSNQFCFDGKCISQADITSCFDSDGGQNYFTYGYVTINVSGVITQHYDECFSTERIFEQYCENATVYHEINAPCPNSTFCFEGVCLSGEIDIQEDFVGQAQTLATQMGFLSTASRVLLVIIIMIVVGIGVNRNYKNIPLTIVAMFLIMVGATYLGWFPIWLLILTFFIGALATYLFVSRLMSGD